MRAKKKSESLPNSQNGVSRDFLEGRLSEEAAIDLLAYLMIRLDDRTNNGAEE